MRYLCIDAYGEVESVMCAKILHNDGHEALAVGHVSASAATISMLADWADVVLALDFDSQLFVPPHQREKIKRLDFGPDCTLESLASALNKCR